MTSIYVGNLSYDATEDDLRKVFERFGHVTRVRIMTDSSTDRSRGFGFVHMSRLDDADEAIQRVNGSSICGRTVIVNEARERNEPGRPSHKPERTVGVFDLL